MATSKVIFNDNGRWHWWFNSTDDMDLSIQLGSDDFQQTWYTAELYYPADPDYDASMHDQQIAALLNKPEELVVFTPSQALIDEIHSLELYSLQPVKFEKASQAVKAFEDGVKLYTKQGEGKFTLITTAPDVLRYLYRLHAK